MKIQTTEKPTLAPSTIQTHLFESISSFKAVPHKRSGQINFLSLLAEASCGMEAGRSASDVIAHAHRLTTIGDWWNSLSNAF